MTIQVDARGLSCPEPVILARRAFQQGEFPVEVIVDTITARENVLRAAHNAGLKAKVEEQGDEFRLIVSK